MLGVIRKRDVLSHPIVTVRCFGWRVFGRALVAKGDRTFLSILVEADVLETQRPEAKRLSKAKETVGRCIRLEERAARLYERFAERFQDDERVCDLFRALQGQETEHAELLALCREAIRRSTCDSDRLVECVAALPGLEDAMLAAEAAATSVRGVEDALRLTIQIESSEVNRLFQKALEATNSEFVRRVEAFQSATTDHLEYIQSKIVDIDPTLADDCRAMAAQRPSPD